MAQVIGGLNQEGVNGAPFRQPNVFKIERVGKSDLRHAP